MQSKLNNPPSSLTALVTRDIWAPQGTVTVPRLPELSEAQGGIVRVPVQDQDLDSMILMSFFPTQDIP